MSEQERRVMYHLFTKGLLDFDVRSGRSTSLKIDEITCDVVFQVGNEETGMEEISGHSALFAAQSDVFRTLLYGAMYESQNRKKDTSNKYPHVVIEDVSPKVFQKCQDYFYGMNSKTWLDSILLQHKQFDQDFISKLFYFANKYLIDGMIQLLAYHVSANFVWDIIHAKQVRGNGDGKDDESTVQQEKRDLLQKYFGLLNRLYDMKLINIVQEIIFQIYDTNQSLQFVEKRKQKEEKDAKATISKTTTEHVVEYILLSKCLHILHPEIVQFLFFGIENHKPDSDGRSKIRLPSFESECLWTHFMHYCKLYCASIDKKSNLVKNANMVADSVSNTEFKENVDNDIITTQIHSKDGSYNHDERLTYRSIMQSYFINYINLDSMSAVFLVENEILLTRAGAQHTTQLLNTLNFDWKYNFIQNYFNHLKRLADRLLSQPSGKSKGMIDSEIWHYLIYVLTKINQHWLRPDEKDHQLIFQIIQFCFAELLAKIASKNGITLDQLLTSTKCSIEIELFVKQLIVLLDKLWGDYNYRQEYTDKTNVFITKIFRCLDYVLKCFYISNDSKIVYHIKLWLDKIDCMRSYLEEKFAKHENKQVRKQIERLFVESQLFDGLIALLNHDISRIDDKYTIWLDAKEAVLKVILRNFGGIFDLDPKHMDQYFDQKSACVDVVLMSLRTILERRIFASFENSETSTSSLGTADVLAKLFMHLKMVLNTDICKMDINTTSYKLQHKIIAGILHFEKDDSGNKQGTVKAVASHDKLDKSIGESLIRCLDVETIKLLTVNETSQFYSDVSIIIGMSLQVVSTCVDVICDSEDNLDTAVMSVKQNPMIATLIKASDNVIGSLIKLLHQVHELKSCVCGRAIIDLALRSMSKIICTLVAIDKKQRDNIKSKVEECNACGLVK